MARQVDKNGKNIGIGWTYYTWNAWWGCTKVHKGCDNCYAEKRSDSFTPNGEPSLWGEGVPRERKKGAFKALNKYQKEAAKAGENRTVFCGSMMDIFEKSKPLSNPDWDFKSTEDLRSRFLSNIPNRYPDLTFLLLTKRPSNINKYIPPSWKTGEPPKNVWFGCSPVDQPTLDTFIKQMAKVKGNKFLSIEPQLGHIDLKGAKEAGIKWIIQGGESGPNRRPFDLAWADSIREQCKALEIAYFFKQIDKVKEIPPSYLVREFPF